MESLSPTRVSEIRISAHPADMMTTFSRLSFSEEAEALRVAASLEAPLAEVPLAVEEPAEDGKSGMLGKNLSGRLLRAGVVVY